MNEITSKGQVTLVKVKNGIDGKDGKDGAPGAPGAPGADAYNAIITYNISEKDGIASIETDSKIELKCQL
jgi:hypothetical protein